MKLFTKYLLAIALVAVLASPLLATNVAGTVKSVDAQQNQFVLTDQNGRDWTIQLGQNAKIQTGNNNQARAQDLRQGQIVNVTYELQGTQLVASQVQAQQAAQTAQQGAGQQPAQAGAQQPTRGEAVGQAPARQETQQADRQTARDQAQANAQQNARGQQQGKHEARGKIESVNADQHQFALKDQNGKDLTFQCGRDARVNLNGKECKLADLQKGQEVTVAYQQMLTEIRAGEKNQQPDNKEQQGQTIQGQIEQVQAAQHQIRLRDQNGKEHTFQLGQNTQVQVNGKNATLADLQQGQQVTAMRQMVANDIRSGEQNQNPNRNENPNR